MSTDVHNHAIPRRVLDLVTSDSRYGVTVADDVWHSANISDFPLVPAWHDGDAKLREMDGRELDRAVLSAAPKPLYFYELDLEPQALVARETNIGLADMCLGREDRLRWMAHVPLAFPAEAAVMLRDAAGRGAAGVQIGTSAAGRRLDGSWLDEFWSAVDDLKMPVFLHPAYEQQIPEYATFKQGVVVGLPAEVTVAVERLICARLFDRYRNVNVVAGLGGGFFPYNEGRLRHYINQGGAELAGAPTDPWSYVGRLKFDSFLHDVPALEFLIKKAGARNVMIGTDCSFRSGTPTPVADVRAATNGNTAAFEQVAETNAHDLFWQYGRHS